MEWCLIQWCNTDRHTHSCSSETLTVSAVDVVLFDKWITPTANMTIKGKVHPRTLRPKGGVEVYLYSFLNIGARWRWVANVMPRPFYTREWPGTNLQVAEWAPVPFWTEAEKPRPPRIRSPEARMESLHQLRYAGTHDHTLQKYVHRLIQRYTEVSLFYDCEICQFDSNLPSRTKKVLVHCFIECGYTSVTGELQIVHKMKHDIRYWFECYLTPRKPSIIYITNSFYLAGSIPGSTLFSSTFKQDRQCTYKRNIEARFA